MGPSLIQNIWYLIESVVNLWIRRNFQPFPGQQQFLIESVCKKWKEPALIIMAKKKILHQLDYYGNKFVDEMEEMFSCFQSLIIDYYNIETLKIILYTLSKHTTDKFVRNSGIWKLEIVICFRLFNRVLNYKHSI